MLESGLESCRTDVLESVLECGERRTCAGERQHIKLCYVYRV